MFLPAFGQRAVPSGLGAHDPVSCLTAIGVGLGTSGAGMKIQRSVWTESPALIQI